MIWLAVLLAALGAVGLCAAWGHIDDLSYDNAQDAGKVLVGSFGLLVLGLFLGTYHFLSL